MVVAPEHLLLFLRWGSRSKVACIGKVQGFDVCSFHTCQAYVQKPVFCYVSVQGLAAGGQEAAVAEYVKAASHKSERERSELQKDKTGVFTGDPRLPPAITLLLCDTSLL
jgi:hypothetical protein